MGGVLTHTPHTGLRGQGSDTGLSQPCLQTGTAAERLMFWSQYCKCCCCSGTNVTLQNPKTLECHLHFPGWTLSGISGTLSDLQQLFVWVKVGYSYSRPICFVSYIPSHIIKARKKSQDSKSLQSHKNINSQL